MLSVLSMSRMLSRTAAVLISTSHAGMRPALVGARHEPQRDDRLQRAGEREAHFGLLVRRIERQHAVDRLRRVRRVQRREHEVAGVGRLERRVERFEISNFADEDDVGILPQHAAQRLRRSVAVSVPTSRWLMWQLMSRCRNSIGSSIVMMFARRCSLMCWIIAASAVDLPEPVTPVTSTSPRGFIAISSSTVGRFSSASVRA